MKVGRYLLLMILLVTSVSMYSQSQSRRSSGGSVEVKGQVVEAGTGDAVEQATVRLLSVRDSSMVAGVATGKNGSFSLKNIPSGVYMLNVSFIGFEPVYQPLQISGQTDPVNVGKLQLKDDAVLLGEAVVTGKAPEVIVRNDTIEYNADSFKVSEGSALEDLLKKMPGVEVSSEGAVTVNGKSINKILVDGKEFFSDDPKVATKNLPSNMVDKVQVLDRLSEMARLTGFDDGDEETVINLTIKPGMKEGWVGNVNAGYGSEDRYEGNFMLNRMINNDRYTLLGGMNNTNNMGFSDMGMFSGMGGAGGRGMMGGGSNGITTSGNIGFDFAKELSKTLTLNGNLRYAKSKNEAESETSQENVQSETRYETGSSFRSNSNDNIGANFRLEWKPDDRTTLIFRPNLSYSKNSQFGSSYTAELDALRDTINYGDQLSRYSGDGYNMDARLEFSRRLNDNGRIFSASISGGMTSRDQDGSNVANTYYANRADDLRDEKIKNDVNGSNFRAYVSWVEPLGRNNFIQLTYNISRQQQESLKNVYVLDDFGNYTVIDTAQTQNYRNDFLTQRASLSFKAIREKYNYTIGFNVDPSNSKSVNFIGDSILSEVKQSVVNFSPTAQFRYNFSRQSNLRIDYDGRTSQPTVAQLQPVPDYSNPRNVVQGNPDLKPYYTNQFRVTYQTFQQESQFTMRVMGGGNYVVNNISSYVINENDGSGNKTTTYRNMNGNYSGDLTLMINTPLKNKKFSINSMTRGSFNNRTTYIGDKVWSDDMNFTIVDSKNKNTNLQIMERAGIDFRSSFLDLGVNGSINYQKTKNTLETSNNQNQNIYNYSVGGNTTIYLPANFKIESDIAWRTSTGYTDGYDTDELLWNASASYSFLKGNAATLRFKMYDILQQRSNVSRTVTANYTRDSQFNTIGSYFMVHFIYRFNIFKGGATMDDSRPGRGQGGPGGHGGGRGGFGGPPMGGGGMPF
ncbi:TonB-dependent receptor [Parabacteroides sp. OttesenSCG-928-J18]|nr:TonB-dependent receptor [Parabacteroides sp. OttesenSCG-928-J18]